MGKLPTTYDVFSLLNSIGPPSGDNKTNISAIELYNRISKASSEYNNSPSCELIERVITLAAQYQYEYKNVDLNIIKNLYDNLDETEDDDLLKQVHRKIVGLYY